MQVKDLSNLTTSDTESTAITLARRLCLLKDKKEEDIVDLWQRQFIYAGLDLDEFDSMLDLLTPRNMYCLWHSEQHGAEREADAGKYQTEHWYQRHFKVERLDDDLLQALTVGQLLTGSAGLPPVNPFIRPYYEDA